MNANAHLFICMLSQIAIIATSKSTTGDKPGTMLYWATICEDVFPRDMTTEDVDPAVERRNGVPVMVCGLERGWGGTLCFQRSNALI
jgi:hypothetical protein